MARVFCLAALLSLASSAAGASWKTCGTGVMTPDTVTLTPDPAVAGKDIAIDVMGKSTAEVKDGKIGVTVSLNVGGSHVPIYSLSIALCDTLVCPAEPGPITVHYGLLLPGIAPAGAYVVQLAGSGSDGAALFCVAVDLEITTAAAATEVPRLPRGALRGAVRRDGAAELKALRAAFEAANAGRHTALVVAQE